MLTFCPGRLEEQLSAYREYAAGLRLIDTYWEEQIATAELFEIREGERPAGCVTLLDDMLTSFFVKEDALLRPAFREVMERFSPKGAFVVTNDEPFLATALDYCRELCPQGFFFDWSGAPVHPAVYPAEWLRPAEEGDLPELRATGFYHPVVIDDPENRIFVLRNPEGEFLGTGHIARMKLDRRRGCVGMYTAPAWRRTGVGRSIILPLLELVRRQGLIPTAGCYFGNTGSRHTLQSCGMTTRTRYMKLSF